MDPKMDPNVDGNRVLSVEERIQNGSFDLNISSEVDLIRIMDRLTQSEFTWYSGKTLPQTVFTCLYLMKIKDITNSTLKLFCKSVLFMIQDIIELMARTPIREEEEFTINTFGFDIYSEDLLDLQRQLKEEEESLKDKVQKEKNQEKKDLLQALYSRIRFRRIYIQIHEYFTSNTLDSIERSKVLINLAEEEFKRISQQHESLLINSDSNDTIGFDRNFTKRISSPHPLKPVDLFTFKEASSNVISYLNQLDFIAKGLKFRDNFPQILDLFHAFSTLNASIIARARMHSCFYHNERICGIHEPASLIRKSLLNLPLLTSHHKTFLEDPERLEDGKLWIHNIGVCFFFIMHALCLNKGKTREKLRGLIVELSEILYKGEMFDQICLQESNESESPPIMTQFIFDKLLEVMELYLVLGLELELYDSIEYGYIFFYLSNISSRRNMNFSVIDELKVIAKTETKKDKKSFRREFSFKRKNIINLHALLHHAYSNILQGLSNLDYYETPSNSKKQFFTYGTEQLRYNHRFSPFLHTQIPRFFNFETYQKQTFFNEDKTTNAIQSINEALNGFTNAIEMSKFMKLEHASILTNNELLYLDHIIEVASSNSVVCKILPLLEKKRTSKIVEFELKNRYPIIKLK